jgi:Cys-rich protein (TIGR01571 family)
VRHACKAPFGCAPNIYDENCARNLSCADVLGQMVMGYPCGCLLHMPLRAAVRRRYGLKEEPCNDCCAVCFCGACSMVQEHKVMQTLDFTFCFSATTDLTVRRSSKVRSAQPWIPGKVSTHFN